MKNHIRTYLLFVWICMSVVVFAQNIKAPTSIATIKWQPSGEFFLVRGQGEDRGWDLWIYDADMQPLALLTDYIDETFGWVEDGEYFFIGRTVFDVHTLKEVYTIASMSGILGWSGEREELLALLPDYKLGFFDAHTGQFTRSLSIGPYVEGIIWSPDGNRIVLADSHTTRIVSADNGHTIAVLDKDYASGLTWSPNSHYVAGFTLTEVEPGTPNTLPYAAGAVIASVVVWDADTGKAVQTYSGLQDVPVFLRWSPDNTQLIGGSSLGLVYVWDLVSEQQLKSFTLPHALYDLVVSPLGGRLFAVAYPAYGDLGELLAEQRTIFPQGNYWSQDFMSGLATVIVIDASIENLRAIMLRCVPVESQVYEYKDTITKDSLQIAAYIDAVKADTVILHGCAADLIAVAKALQEQ